jgi:hypothetical protein
MTTGLTFIVIVLCSDALALRGNPCKLMKYRTPVLQ